MSFFLFPNSPRCILLTYFFLRIWRFLWYCCSKLQNQCTLGGIWVLIILVDHISSWTNGSIFLVFVSDHLWLIVLAIIIKLYVKCIYFYIITRTSKLWRNTSIGNFVLIIVLKIKNHTALDTKTSNQLCINILTHLDCYSGKQVLLRW